MEGLNKLSVSGLPDGVHIREYIPEDGQSLQNLWSRIFADPPSLVNSFLQLLPEMGTACVAERNNDLLGAAYLLDGYTLVAPDRAPMRVGYLYAVAVTEAARGHGLGEAVSRGAAELGQKRGMDILCTLPAESSLYHWYEKILSLRHVCSRAVWQCDELPAAERISAASYLKKREALLATLPHVVPNLALMEYQRLLSEAYGGGLYATDSSVYLACRGDDRWLITEYLSSPPNCFPGHLSVSTQSYVCADRPLPDGLIWNITLD